MLPVIIIENNKETLIKMVDDINKFNDYVTNSIEYVGLHGINIDEFINNIEKYENGNHLIKNNNKFYLVEKFQEKQTGYLWNTTLTKHRILKEWKIIDNNISSQKKEDNKFAINYFSYEYLQLNSIIYIVGNDNNFKIINNIISEIVNKINFKDYFPFFYNSIIFSDESFINFHMIKTLKKFDIETLYKYANNNEKGVIIIDKYFEDNETNMIIELAKKNGKMVIIKSDFPYKYKYLDIDHTYITLDNYIYNQKSIYETINKVFKNFDEFQKYLNNVENALIINNKIISNNIEDYVNKI